MTDVDKLRQALKAMSQQGIGRPIERGLTEQDHEMFNRIFKRILEEEQVPLKDRCITVPRVTKVKTYEVLGMPVQSKPSKSNAAAKSKRSTPLDSDTASKLQTLHTRISSLSKREE